MIGCMCGDKKGEMKMKTRFNAFSVVVAVTMMVVALSGCSSTNSAMQSGAAGMDLGKQLMGSFGDAGNILGSITGSDSAQSAVSQLDAVGVDLDQLAKTAADASPETKASLSDIVGSQIPGFKEITDKAYAIPGVKPVVKPSVDSLLSKFAGF